MSAAKKRHTRITRRAVLAAGAAAAGLASVPYGFVRARAAGDPKRLVLYNNDGSLGDFYLQNWMRPFEEQHDVTIETIRLKGGRAPLEKIQAQIAAGAPETDVIQMHSDQFIFAKRNDLLMEIPASEMPEYESLYDKFVTPYGPSLVLWCYILAYNTEKVSPAPTSWKALWDDKYAGKVALNEALKEQVLEMTNLAWKGEPYPVDDETFEHLSDIRPNLVALWSSGADAEQLFRNGEIVMTPFWNGRVTKLKAEGLPLEAAVPDEGFFVRSSVYGIPRKAKNPELAMQWINWVCGRGPQKKIVEFGYGTPNKTVEHTPEEAAAVIVADPKMVEKVVPEDYERILDKSDEWSARWTRWKAS